MKRFATLLCLSMFCIAANAQFKDSLTVRIKLAGFVDSLDYNFRFASDSNALEYAWGVHIDADNDSTTGQGNDGRELEISSLYYSKIFGFTGRTSFADLIINKSQNVTWSLKYNTITVEHDLRVYVDIAAREIILVADLSWPEVAKISPTSSIQGFAYRYKSGFFYYEDLTDVETVSDVINDMNDAEFPYIDIERVTVGDNTPVSTGELLRPAVSVYPNPVEDMLYIDLEPGTGPTKVSITDVTGKTVTSAETEAGGKIAVPCHHLAAGIYFYTLSNTAGTLANGKIVVR